MCCIANYPLSLSISVNLLPANCLSYLNVTFVYALLCLLLITPQYCSRN